MGRPYALQPDEKTLKTLEGLGRIQSTTKEAAAVLNVSEPTFLKFIESYQKARDIFERAKETGKSSLRRAQLKAALEGNTTMMVWMGKQLLGQRDKLEHGITGKDGGPIQVESTMSPKTAAEAYAAMLKDDD